MRARQEHPLLERAAVHGVGEQVLTDAGVVEQRVAVPDGAVCRHCPARTASADQELYEVVAGCVDDLGETGVALDRGESGGAFVLKHLGDSRAGKGRALDGHRPRPQRSAVRRELFHVDDREARLGEHPLGREEGQVREVLVVDRVVEPVLDQPEQVMDLDGHGAVVLHQSAQAAGEVDDTRHPREDIVRHDEVGLAVVAGDRRACRLP